MKTGSTPIFWAATAVSIINVVFPVSDPPRAIVTCPIGTPGIERALFTAGENGIHLCFLNLDAESRNLDFLNASISKDFLSESDTTDVKVSLLFAINN